MCALPTSRRRAGCCFSTAFPRQARRRCRRPRSSRPARTRARGSASWTSGRASAGVDDDRRGASFHIVHLGDAAPARRATVEWDVIYFLSTSGREGTMKRVGSFAGCATLLLAVLSLHFTPIASAQTHSSQAGGDPVEIVAMTSGHANDGSGSSIALDATGRFAAIVSATRAELWDIEKGRLIRTFFSPSLQIADAVAVSMDGARIAVGGTGKEIVVWETRTGRVLAAPESQVGWVKSLAFSKDGRHLVYGGNAKVDILKKRPAAVIQEIETGRIITTIDSFFPVDVVTAYSPARNLVAVGDPQGVIHLLDIGGRLIRAWDAQEKGAEKKPVRGLAFSPDGSRLASGEFQSSLVRIWEIPEGRLLRTLPAHDNRYGVRSLSWSPDGAKLATVDSDAIRI